MSILNKSHTLSQVSAENKSPTPPPPKKKKPRNYHVPDINNSYPGLTEVIPNRHSPFALCF